MAELNGWWVTGLVDGEGCFYAGLQHRNKKTSSGNTVACVELDIRLQVALRADDTAVLDRLPSYFGCGIVTNKKFSINAPSVVRLGLKGKPVRNFQIRKPQDLLDYVVPHFDKYPLQSKKSRDYAIWKDLLNYASDNLIGRKGWLRRFPNEVDLLGSMCEDLRSLRTYSTLLAGVN